MLKHGKIPIVEEGLHGIVLDGLALGILRFTTSMADALVNANFVFMCLPTPQADDGSVDTSYLMNAVEQASTLLKFGSVLVNKSTIPVGTASLIKKKIKRFDVAVVSNPEFLREGSAVHDFLHPDRIVIGSDDHEASLKVASLYEGVQGRVIITDAESAELIKYAANSFLATKLSFINSIAELCEKTGANILDVIIGMGSDSRIGESFLSPGPGWGGSCFPKDTRGLLNQAKVNNTKFDVLLGTVSTNEHQFQRVADKVKDICGGSVEGKKIGVWGLTFKANTDDLRDSPAISICSILLRGGAKICAYDPAVGEESNRVGSSISIAKDPVSAARDADVLVVLTEWDEFRDVDPAAVADVLGQKAVYDARGVLQAGAWRAAGVVIEVLGHPRG